MLEKCAKCNGTGEVKGPVATQAGPLTVEGVGVHTCSACRGYGNVEFARHAAIVDRLVAWNKTDTDTTICFDEDGIKDVMAKLKTLTDIIDDARELRTATATEDTKDTEGAQ